MGLSSHRGGLKGKGLKKSNAKLKRRTFLRFIIGASTSLAGGGGLIQANSFLSSYKKLLEKHSINLLNVTVRKVKKDTNALVSYAQQDMYGFVVYYKVEQKRSDIQVLSAFTKELIDYLLSIKATYYLCYGGYYSPSQLITMYPEIHTLFHLKAEYDPSGIFTNVWYEKYHRNV